jgi:2-haloacid dehalogenase
MTDMDRRSFLAATGTVALSALVPFEPAQRATIRAVAFDGFALFDATAILKTAESVAPRRGAELVAAWRSRHFQYQWLRTLGGRYADFRRTADDALAVTAEGLGIALSDASRLRLVEAQETLQPWPDAVNAVQSLKRAGVRLAMLSNMTGPMLEDGLQRAGIRDAFELVLSTDRVRAAKPSPSAYEMAPRELGLPRDQIAFVAFASWDATGAAWFGFPTAWLNKANAVPERLDAAPRIAAHDLSSIVDWILTSR